MMRKCWEMDPNNRPLFKDLHTITSQYIEHIAGYLELEFNPFTGRARVNEEAMLKREMEGENGGYDKK